MDIKDAEAKNYLVELYNQTQGNEETQISMHEVGALLGMEKTHAGTVAQELIVEGFVDLKTLAGGINITAKGLDMLQQTGHIMVTQHKGLQLSGEPILNEADHQVVQQVVATVRAAAMEATATYGNIEEIIMDIKTIEVQLLSPKPKTAIIRSVLHSLRDSLEKAGGDKAADALGALLQ